MPAALTESPAARGGAAPRAAAPGAGEKDGLALYIHWPFCASKCPYCDFNSHVRALVPEEEWVRAILSEMKAEAELLPGRRLTSVFFGGGTPSLMSPASAGSILARAASLWPFAADMEITLEANPSSVEAERFRGFAAAGVNRVSLGLQALNDADLRALGRGHDVSEGLAALEAAQTAFRRVSFDLIYAREAQTPEAWEAELRRAIALGTRHMSLYQLTIEPGTHFAARHARGELRLPPEDPSADMFEATREIMREAGLPAYEVSNYAAPGEESRHNLTYWRYGDYAGVGPGAHGRRRGHASQRIRLPERWLQAVTSGGSGLTEDRRLAPAERAAEALMMGLRLTEGIDAASFERRTDMPLSSLIDANAARELQADALLSWNGERLKLKEPGLLLLDAILPRLML